MSSAETFYISKDAESRDLRLPIPVWKGNCLKRKKISVLCVSVAGRFRCIYFQYEW